MRSLFVILIVTLPLYAFQGTGLTEEMMEETGESGLLAEGSWHGAKTPVSNGLVLLVPESTADAVGMYDPFDGTYLGDFIVDDSTGVQYDLQTPINAVQGPFGYVYLSDQVSDAVYAFDQQGNFLYVAAETGLNNIRGIDFRDDTMYVTSGDDYVAMFSGPDTFSGYFIQDGTDPFDILFVDEVTSGSALLADIQGSTDNIRHYDHDGTLLGELFQVSFPEQVQIDAGNPGYYLVAGFSVDSILRFTIDGSITDKWYIDAPRGVYRLGNGNLLVTDGDGVHEMDAGSGAILETEHAGSGRFIELADLPPLSIEQGTPSGDPGDVVLAPNPFQTQLAIGFTLPEASAPEIVVYSISGRVVEVIAPGMLGAGTHTVVWDGTSTSGLPLEQGVYFVRVTAPGMTATSRVNLVR